MKKVRTFIIAVSFSSFLFFVSITPASAAGVPTNFINNLTISNPYALVGEKLTITLHLQQLYKIKKAVIKIDDKNYTVCKVTKSKCVASLKQFTDDDVGEHTFLVEVTPKKGAVFTSGGTFTVVAEDDKDEVIQYDEEIANGTDMWLADWKANNKFIPAKNNLPPAFAGITAKTFEPQVGKKWTLTGWANNKSELIGMGVYIDEEIPESGIGAACVMCVKGNYPANNGTSVGPFSKDDVGQHTYGVLVVGKNGYRRVVKGTFEVKP